MIIYYNILVALTYDLTSINLWQANYNATEESIITNTNKRARYAREYKYAGLAFILPSDLYSEIA